MRKGKKNAYPPLHLRIEQEDKDPWEKVFTSSFRIGRDADCDLIVHHSHISRHHVEVDFRDHCWWVHDLESTNGIYVNEKKVMHAPVLDKDVLMLGQDGPQLTCTYISAEEAVLIEKKEVVKEGEKKQRAWKKSVVYGVAVVVLALSGFLFGQNELGQQERLREKALALFTEVRTQNVAIAEAHAEDEVDRLSKAQKIIELQSDRNKDLDTYRGYLIRIGFYGEIDDRVKRQIYSASALFAENELTLPPTFVEEVSEAIRQYWLVENINTMTGALDRAQFFNYSPHLLKSLHEYGLPREFFYLPLTVSGFDAEKDLLSGYEVLAGVWRLSAQSAERYGLESPAESERNTGYVVDDRYDFQKSTSASVRMLHDIYRQEAYASGLLTLALYLQYQENHAAGKESEVGTLLADVPADLSMRNLWYIRERYPFRISPEVYTKVVRIFAAAVIGQDPQVFDLDFATPTASNMSDNIYRAFQ